MPIPTNIKTLLEGRVVEWARIEYKESWKPEASLKTICAFANDLDNWGGGYLLIGVEETDGRPKFPVKGVPLGQVDNIMKDLLNKCKQIKPDYLPIVEPVEYKGKTIIVVWCPGGPTRPYKSPSDFIYKSGKAFATKENTYYIRKMSSTIAPSELEISELFSLANNVPFDDRINHGAELDDLNITLIKSYLREIGSSLYSVADQMGFEELCMSMGISNTMPEYMKPKNVGLLFFSMNPEKFIPYAQIEIVSFPDGVGGDNIIEKYFKGPLHQQLREALQYIQNVVITDQIIKYPHRAEADHVFNYPYAAIEEALANAVYHKGYDVREPIEVRIERNKIEILSFPGPDRSITKEGLREYHVNNRRYRNRRIGEFLKELHLTEGRNTGFQKILDAIRRNGSPAPEFETDDDYTYFISRFFIHPLFIQNSVENIGEPIDSAQNSETSTQEMKTSNQNIGTSNQNIGTSTQNLDKLIMKLSEKEIENVKLVINCINNQEKITVKEVAEILGKSISTARRYIKKMVDNGVLIRDGVTSNTQYKLSADI